MPVLRLAVLFAAAAFASTAVASAALTPSAYRAHANSACAKANAQLNALGQLTQTSTNADVAKLLSAGLAISWRSTRHYARCIPPGRSSPPTGARSGPCGT